MSQVPKIQVFLKQGKNAVTPMGGKVILDGQEVKGLTDFNFNISGNSVGKVTLTLVGELDIQIEPLSEQENDELEGNKEPEEKIT